MKNIIWLVLGFISISHFAYSQKEPFDFAAAQNEGKNEILATWTDKNDDRTGFYIYYVTGSKTDSLKIDKDKESTIIPKLTNGSTYGVYMKTFKIFKNIIKDDTTYSPKTATINIKIDTYDLKASTNLKLDVNSLSFTSFSVLWEDKSTSESGYIVTYKEVGKTTIVAKKIAANAKSYKLDKLKDGTTYEVYVQSYKVVRAEDVLGPKSSTLNITTIAAIPPVATNFVELLNCPTNFIFSWKVDETKTTNLGSFTIERSTDKINWTIIKEGIGATIREYSDKTVTPGTTHHYRLTSKGKVTDDSAVSVIYTVNIKPYTKPQMVTDLGSDQFSKTPNSLKINWTNPNPSTKPCDAGTIEAIYIFVTINGVDVGNIAVLPINANTYTINNLNPGDIVQVSVRNLSISEQGGQFSENVAIQDQTIPFPNTPSNFQSEVYIDAINNPTVKLTWTDTAIDEEGYVLMYGESPENMTQLGKIKSNQSEFIHTPVEEGKTYFYKIQTFNYVGPSAFSANLEVKINAFRVPNPPVGLKASINGADALISWRDDSIREDEFILERSEDSGSNFTVLAVLPRNTTEYLDKGLINGNKYTYRVKTKNPIIESEYSKAITFIMGQTSIVLTDASLVVYPNPTLNFLKVKTELGNIEHKGKVKIYNINNQVVLANDVFFGSEENTFDLRKLKSGLYNIIFELGNERVSKRIVKQ